MSQPERSADILNSLGREARLSEPGGRMLRVGPLELDPWRQVAMLDGKPLALTPIEFRVLLCLAEHAGMMRGYAQIVEYAQGYATSELEAGELIKPHIHHLRRKLEPDPRQPRYILNVRGRGYLLALGE
jgi:DNA-binding response OmpR family regulator